MFAFGAPVSRGHAVLRGFVAAGLGIACLVWPGVTIGVAVALFCDLLLRRRDHTGCEAVPGR
jgi:hypothetical protein